MILTRLLPLALLAGLGSAVPLASATEPPLTGEEIATTGNGRGSTPCVSCHGPAGEGNSAAGFPRIAGQDPGYLARQVRLIRDGERTAAVMSPGVAGMTDAEIEAVATYYSGLPLPSMSVDAPDPAAAEAASALVLHGDWPGRDLPACNRCHGPGARGVNQAFPGLAGQHAPYLKAQLEAFRSGTRATDPGDLMGTVARKLTDDEIAALASWLAAQPATPPADATAPEVP